MNRYSSISIVLALFFQVLNTGCKKEDPVKNQDLVNITLGPVTDVSSTAIGSGGGSIKVSKPGTPVDGLEIIIPDSSYISETRFTISYAEIVSHKFGENFSPISPMITVACDGGYSGKLMSITIPVKIPDGHVAIGFYLDETTGKLEGIPVGGVTPNSITLLTRHFLSGNKLRGEGSSLKSASTGTNKGANIIISSFAESILNLQPIIASGFKPGVDDWEFVNYGSYIAPGGHCAGQNMSAMWYYFEKKPSEGNLFNKFSDNPNLWQDNARGYRFSSVLQEALAGGKVASFFWKHIDKNQELDRLKLYTIAGAMLVTGEPQEIGVYRQNGTSSDGTAAYSGHSLICYQVSLNDGKLFVSDPNKPGIGQLIEFKNNKFEPYIAKLNGEAASNPYPFISYSAKTAWIDWDKIGSRYAEVIKGTIGYNAPDTFPSYTIFVKGKVDSELTDGFSTDSDTLRSRVICEAAEFFRLTEKNQKMIRFEVYDESGMKINDWDEDDECYVILKPGLNKIGFYIFAKRSGVVDQYSALRNLFVDFKWLNVYYSKLKIDPDPIAGEPDKEIEITARSGGTAPNNAKYVWNFGDGSAEVSVSNDSIVRHKFSSEGIFDVMVKLYDNSNNMMVAADTVKANIAKGILSRLQKCQYATIQFSADMLTNEGFSFGGIHLTNRPPTLSTGGNCPLVWGGASFSAKVDYTAKTSQPGETQHITGTIGGTMSANGLIVTNLTAHLTTETNTAQTTNQDISVLNVPYDQNRPSYQIFEIKSPTVRQYVSAFAWELVYFDGAVQKVRNVASINYNNPDDVPRLSIYFEEQ